MTNNREHLKKREGLRMCDMFCVASKRNSRGAESEHGAVQREIRRLAKNYLYTFGPPSANLTKDYFQKVI